MIADRRELYNDQVYRYNTRIAQVPALVLAALFGWRARPFFAATPSRRDRGPARTCGRPDERPRGRPRPRLLSWLVRHGETEWAASGRHTGRTDIPLTDARHAARRGSSRTRLGGSRSRSSCHEPAVAGARDLPARRPRRRAVVDPDLREWDYGAYEGRTTDEIRERGPGLDDLVGPGPRRRVDRRRSRRRADRVIDAALESRRRRRALRARPLPADPRRPLARAAEPAAGALFELSTATISRLGWERERRVIELWNDGCHLAHE